MACFTPLSAWYSKEQNETGKRPLVFSRAQALDPDSPLEIACGQCIGCRLERSKQWAVRCMHEASLYEDNCFITLTFNPESLEKREFPESLDKRDFQLFMKRLRKKFGANIRYFHCGEYGDELSRPHYHACLFNFDFPDKKLFKITPTGSRLYISDALSKLWPFGFSTIGDVTFESAAYVARYITKKQTGKNAHKHYELIDKETGEVKQLKPEYTTMSRRPGIGKAWFDKYHKDVYPKDFITVNGVKMRPPKYYDKEFEKLDSDYYSEIKAARIYQGLNHQDNNTVNRRCTREKVQENKMKLLVRPYEKGQQI